VTLMEKAQELVDKAKHAAGRLTGDRNVRPKGKAQPPRTDRRDRAADQAKDNGDRPRAN
jgi:uncharacterized protein YjbJ (UPF0337 family)